MGVLTLLQKAPALLQLAAAVIVGVVVYGGVLWLQGPDQVRDTLRMITSALRGG
jgi:hypothetical protein